MEKDERNFARRDAADLFTASALANDKDGKLTERERSLSSAFFSREGLEDSGSEDAQVNHRANPSVTVSGPLGSDGSVGSESETSRDSTEFLGDYATEDLDLVENAILRLLREDGRSSSKPHNKDSTKLKGALGLDEHLEGSEQTQSSAGAVDLQLLSRLLDQVQTLREQKYQHRQAGRAARSLSRGRSTKRGGKDKRISKDDMKKAVEAATQAAKSAAEAAKNASSLVTKNSEVVGKLLQSLNPSASEATSKKQENKTSSDNPEYSESSSDSEESSDSDDMKAIAKRIVTQNRYTHVVLGIMLVSSFVWRYIVVKVVKRVKNKVSDPWGYVGGMLTDNFKGPEKEKKEKEKGKGKTDSGEEHSSGLNMPHLNLPPLLQGEQHQEKKTSTSDVEEERVEERSLTFGNIMQSKSNSSK